MGAFTLWTELSVYIICAFGTPHNPPALPLGSLVSSGSHVYSMFIKVIRFECVVWGGYWCGRFRRLRLMKLCPPRSPPWGTWHRALNVLFMGPVGTRKSCQAALVTHRQGRKCQHKLLRYEDLVFLFSGCQGWLGWLALNGLIGLMIGLMGWWVDGLMGCWVDGVDWVDWVDWVDGLIGWWVDWVDGLIGLMIGMIGLMIGLIGMISFEN